MILKLKYREILKICSTTPYVVHPFIKITSIKSVNKLQPFNNIAREYLSLTNSWNGTSVEGESSGWYRLGLSPANCITLTQLILFVSPFTLFLQPYFEN